MFINNDGEVIVVYYIDQRWMTKTGMLNGYNTPILSHKHCGVIMSWQQQLTPSGVTTWSTFQSGHRIQWCS